MLKFLRGIQIPIPKSQISRFYSTTKNSNNLVMTKRFWVDVTCPWWFKRDRALCQVSWCQDKPLILLIPSKLFKPDKITLIEDSNLGLFRAAFCQIHFGILREWAPQLHKHFTAWEYMELGVTIELTAIRICGMGPNLRQESFRWL